MEQNEQPGVWTMAFFPDVHVRHGLQKCLPDDVILDRKIKESFFCQGTCTNHILSFL